MTTMLRRLRVFATIAGNAERCAAGPALDKQVVLLHDAQLPKVLCIPLVRIGKMKTNCGLSHWAHQLSVLEAMVRCGSVGAAATHLDMSARDVSRSLRKLEAAMGTVLFTRTERRIGLTQAGEILHAAVSAGICNIRESASRRQPERSL